MSATVRTEDGELRIDLVSFAESLPPETKHEIAKACAFDEELITMVVGLVGNGWAFEQEDGGWSLGTQTLTRIREGLVPLMDKAVRELVGHLLRERDQEHLEAMRYQVAYWKLWHHHNDDHGSSYADDVPKHPELVQPPWPTVAGTQAVIDEAREKWGAS